MSNPNNSKHSSSIMPPPSPISSTIPGNNALPTPSTTSVSSATHQERLEEASKVCARGRELWSQGSRNNKSHGNTNGNKNSNASLALAEFEYALRLLEPLLGTYHSLTAKTYYWIGFIQKHDSSTYQPALQAFLQTARIRLVLLGPSHESTQEALSAIRWVLQELSLDSNSSKALLQTLYESIRLETLGDIQLRHKNYASALDYYQQAASPPHLPSSTTTTATPAVPTTTPPSSPAYTTAALLLSCTPTLWGKRAFCHSKLQLLNNDNNNNEPGHNHHQHLALVGYRHALELFVCTTVHGIHHFDIPQTMERIQALLLAPTSSSSSSDPHPPIDKAMIQEYCSTRVLKAVSQEYQGKQALNQGHFVKALEHFQVAYQLESPILGDSHLVCVKLQQTINAIRTILDETPQLIHLITTLHDTQDNLQTQLDDARTTSSKPIPPSTNNNAIDGDDGGVQSRWTPSQILQLQHNYETKCREQEALQLELQGLQQEQHQGQIKAEKDRLAILELESRLLLLQQQQLQGETTHVTNHLPQEKEQLRQEEDVTALTEQLVASQQLTKELQVRLVTAEQSLSEVTLSRHNTNTKLNAAIVEQNALQAQIQQQDLTIRKLQDQLQELQQQQHDATSHSAETNLTSPSRPGKSVYPGTPLSTFSEFRPSETQRNLALQLQELQTAQTLEKLQSQNARAVTTIQALSKELTNLESKYRKLFSKYEKTKILFRQLESKHSTLKERVRLGEEDKVIVDRQRGGGAAASVAANPRPTIIRQRDSPTLYAILRSVRLSQYRYKSSLAQYIVRRPYGMDDSGYFNDASANSYQRQANVMDSTTIQLVAVVPSDQSRLYVTSSTGSMVHHRADGSCVELSVEPLGWVMLNNDQWYSLDALVEEAIIFREHYCQSVLLNAKPILWEQRILQLIGRYSPSVEQWAYRYGSKAFHHYGPLDHARTWFFGIAMLMVLLSMVLAQMSEEEETA